MRRFIPLCCALLMLAATASVAIAQDPAGEENSISTLNAAPMPDVTKLAADEARRKVQSAGIYADFEYEFVTTPKTRSDKPGSVVEQDPPAGDEVESGVGDFEPILLTIYSPKPVGGNGGDTCRDPKDPVTKAFNDFDADAALPMLQKLKIKPNFDIKPFTPASLGIPALPRIDKMIPTPPSLTKLPGPKLPCLVVVQPPTQPENQSLFLTIQARSRRMTFDKSWQLTVGQPNFFTIQVSDRAGHVLNGAKVQLDLSAVGGPDVVGTTRAVGKTSVKVTPKKAGTFNMLATAQGGNGQTLSGLAKIKVVDRGSSRQFDTFTGDRFVRRGRSGVAVAAQANQPFRFDFAKKVTVAPTPTPGPNFEATCKVYTLVFDPRLTKCPLDWLKKLGAMITDPVRPISDLLGTIKVGSGTGISISPGDNNVIGKVGNVITGILDPLKNTVSDVFNNGRNLFVGIGNVAQNVANTIIPPSLQNAARAAGEFVNKIGTFLAPPSIMPPLAHVLPALPIPGLPGPKAPTPPKGAPPVFNPPTPLIQQVTNTVCKVGGTLLSGFVPSFLNPFKSGC